MTGLWDEIVKYKEGKIKIEELLKKMHQAVAEVGKIVENEGIDAYAFKQTANEEMDYVEDASNEENMLRFDAMICDIANNLFHALKECRQGSEKIRLLANEMVGIKKGMAIEIINECKKVGNKSYGMQGESFFVDIPMCGQIAWHFPYKCGLEAQEYKFPAEVKTVQFTNKKLLCEGLTRRELGKFSERMAGVLDCQTVEELNNFLFGEPSMAEKLSSQVNETLTDDSIDYSGSEPSQKKEDPGIR